MIERNDYSLLKHNSFGIDVKAKHFIEYKDEDELLLFLQQGKLKKPFLHIGEGSNLLFLHDYEGMILHSAIRGVEIIEESKDQIIVQVGAGENWDEFVAYCVEHEWYGAENLSLIPGEVGAAAVQNIGAYGVELKDLVHSIETIDTEGNFTVYTVSACEYAYRHSVFKKPENKNLFITRVNLCLSKNKNFYLDYGSIRKELDKDKDITLKKVRDVIIKIREEKLPNPDDIGNGGSFFMNPVIAPDFFNKLQNEYPDIPFYKLPNDTYKIPAAWMIDQCGWKGKKVGNVGVYPKQALVLVNYGGATGKEVFLLAKSIQDSVNHKFGIKLRPEVNYIGSYTK